MKILMLLVAFAGSLAVNFARAEEKTCVVDGPHCTGCTEMIEGKVCDEAKYSTCKVDIVDEDKHIGQLHLVTKDKAAKIDEKGLAKTLTDMESDYSLKKCSSGPPPKTAVRGKVSAL